jgi:hypothetical protein
VRPGEWVLVIEIPETGRLADGRPAPAGTPEDDVYYPIVFRDAGEIRPADPAVAEMRAIFPESGDEPGPREPRRMSADPSCIVCGREHQR